MKTKVADTSIQSYESLVRCGIERTQYERVLDYLKLRGELTINQIARGLNIYPSTISARLNALLVRGCVKQTGEVVKDSITGKSNMLWRVV